MRTTSNRTEIIDLISQIRQQPLSVLLWQNSSGARTISYGIIKSIDTKLGSFALSPEKQDKGFEFDKSLSIYMKGEVRDLLFKGELQFNSKNLIIINIPEQAKVIERRISARTLLNPFGNTPLSLSKSMQRGEETRPFALQLLDISLQGLSFKITEQHISHFHPGEQIFINAIAENRLAAPLQAKIVYLTSIKSLRQKHKAKIYKIGVLFKSEVPKSTFEKISKSLSN